jgi:hypothetical protein
MSIRQTVSAAITLLALALHAAVAHAKGGVDVEALQILGSSSPAADGWFTVGVRLRSSVAKQQDGHVELIAELPYASSSRVVTRAPFALGAREEALLELPTHGFYGIAPALKLRVLDAAGDELALVDVPDPGGASPFLFDLTVPSRISPVLRARGVPVQASAGMRTDFPLLATSSPRVHPATGRALVPGTNVGYAPATVVLAQSATLAQLEPNELEALGNWVLSGGALAVVVTRPEDLRGPVLRAFLGGEAQAATVPDMLRRERIFAVPSEPSSVAPGPSVAPGRSPSAPRVERQTLAPSSVVAAGLVHFTGGNLKDCPWGAAASYGLGEVHLLAFDATKDPFVSDAWVQLSLVDLVRHAWQRDRFVTMAVGRPALNQPYVHAVVRELDPNQQTRWTIALSALLLLAYAVVAGPLNFYRAARRGKPLRALVFLPVYAAGAVASIIAIGMMGRGVQGRSRRLSFVEAGAGMAKGSIIRYRAFFASSSDELLVRAGDRRNVLDVAGQLNDASAVIALDRDGLRLEQLQANPWQTVVVREDGFVSLGAGVSMVQNERGETVVVNRTARDLRSVVVKLPGRDAAYFLAIKDGQSVNVSTGRTLSHRIGEPLSAEMPKPLSSGVFASVVDEQAPGLSSAWDAIEQAARTGADWWPSDVPVLIAELDERPARASDSGLKLDQQRTLIRVVGYGGLP